MKAGIEKALKDVTHSLGCCDRQLLDGKEIQEDEEIQGFRIHQTKKSHSFGC